MWNQRSDEDVYEDKFKKVPKTSAKAGSPRSGTNSPPKINKFMEAMEVASKEYSIKNSGENTSVGNLDDYLSVTEFLDFNKKITSIQASKSEDGSYVIKNFQMFDIQTLEELPKDKYLNIIDCEPKKSDFVDKAAYKLL